jgi:hypothetical protein
MFNLNRNKPHTAIPPVTVALLFATAISACSVSEQILVDDFVEPVTEITEVSEFSFGFDINEYRIRPEDVFFSNQNEVPNIFLPDTLSMTEAQRNAGFRVQIISSQDVREVEMVRAVFLEWLFDHVKDYDPEAYILFRQPFFRLHVGDFRSRSDAIAFNNIVKRRFPDAWVVHDQINPENITLRRIPPQSSDNSDNR